jgi:hypothetical protein
VKARSALLLVVGVALIPSCEGCQIKLLEIDFQNARPESCNRTGNAPPDDEPLLKVDRLCSDDPLNPRLGHDSSDGANDGIACSCGEYGGEYPFGVFNQGETQGAGATCKDEGSYTQNNARAWPDCAKGAEASGYVVGSLYPFSPEDHDVSFNICPIEDADGDGEPHEHDVAMHIFPLSYEPIELRSFRSFRLPANTNAVAVGRLHIEVQGCRFYDGSFSVGGALPYPTRPLPGDLVSMAGDWW